MKKRVFYSILFVLSAYLCFLAACGSGEIVDLSSQDSPEWREINKTLENLADGGGLISKCQDPKEAEGTDCPEIKVAEPDPEPPENGGDPGEGGGNDPGEGGGNEPGEGGGNEPGEGGGNEPGEGGGNEPGEGNGTSSSSVTPPPASTPSSSSATPPATTPSSSSTTPPAATPSSSSTTPPAATPSSSSATPSSSSVTPSSSSVTTPPTSGSSTACEFQQSWCPGVDWANGISWGETFSDTQGKCFFLSGASNSAPSCNNSGCYVNKGDGGFYLYVNTTPTYGISNSGTPVAKPTNCVGPTL